MVIQRKAPVWGIGGVVMKGDKVGAAIESMIECFNASPLLIESWSERKLKRIGDVSERDGVGPGL